MSGTSIIAQIFPSFKHIYIVNMLYLHHSYSWEPF